MHMLSCILAHFYIVNWMRLVHTRPGIHASLELMKTHIQEKSSIRVKYVGNYLISPNKEKGMWKDIIEH